MKVVKLTVATVTLQDKKLSEQQKKALLGGAKCPYCKDNFDSTGLYSLSWDACTGVSDYNHKLVTDDIQTKSKAETESNFSQERRVTGIVCSPRKEYYNIASGF